MCTHPGTCNTQNEKRRKRIEKVTIVQAFLLSKHCTVSEFNFHQEKKKKRPLFPFHGRTETQVQNFAQSPREYTAELGLARKSARAPSLWVFNVSHRSVVQTGMCHGMGEAPDPPSKHIGWEHEEPAEVGRIQLPPFIHCCRVKGSSPKILPRGEIMSSS